MSRRGGGARRPPVKKVSRARVARPVARGTRVVRLPEGIRYLRADGTPNWRQWIPRREGEAKLVASHPAVTASPTSSILEVIELITENKVRGVVLAEPGTGTLRGLVTATDLVNYLGGGEYYNIIKSRYKYNIYRALRDEPVKSIANPTPLYATVNDSLDSIIGLMVANAVGIVPIVHEDGSVYGVITEHDVVARIAGRKVGVKVEDAMSRNLVVVNIEAPIREAAQTMTRFGFRRLPVVSDEGEVRGIVTAKDYVYFFGSHRVFRELTEPNIDEILENVKVYEVMTPEFYTISKDADIGDAAEAMNSLGVSSLLVVDEYENIIGIITERDVLVSIV